MFRMSRPALSRCLALSASLVLLSSPVVHAAGTTLLNVSCDVSRGFCKDDKTAFAARGKQTTGEDLTLNQSHDGASCDPIIAVAKKR